MTTFNFVHRFKVKLMKLKSLFDFVYRFKIKLMKLESLKFNYHLYNMFMTQLII